jgi:hypothetical protein
MEGGVQGLNFRKVQEKASTMPLIRTKRITRKLSTFSLRVSERSKVLSFSLREVGPGLLPLFMEDYRFGREGEGFIGQS